MEYKIYWYTTDNVALHYVDTVTNLQSARDYCMSTGFDPSVIHCIYRQTEKGEELVSRYHLSTPTFELFGILP